MRFYILASILYFFQLQLFAQQSHLNDSTIQETANRFSIKGTIIDAKTKEALIGVDVFLKSITDSTITKDAITDFDGNFILENIEKGNYKLSLKYISYKTNELNLQINHDTDLKSLELTEDSKLLKEVVIESTQIRVQQLGDTSQYNANAFKVNQDATTEDLLTKMPGMTSENGTIKVNGEEVKKVLVDGKEFFGSDTKAAIQNLPADIVDKIQVFDKLSDQSAFTGFDDGEGVKTINIVTKGGISSSQFGKIYAGYGGPNNRYNTGLNYNTFQGNRRISILGMSNNINQQNFNIQDLMGSLSTGNSGFRPGGGGPPRGGNPINNFLVGQRGGISTTTAFGLNYSDIIGKNKKVNISGSYFFNGSKTINNNATFRDYILQEDNNLTYNEQNNTTNKDFNNRLNLKIEYKIDSSNILTFTPNFSIQNNNTNSILNANNLRNDSITESSTQNNQFAQQLGINFSNNILYQHKFLKKGRTISANFNTIYGIRNTDRDLYSLNSILFNEDTINQKSILNSNNYTIGGNIVYTEPIKKNGQISINLTPSFINNYSIKNTDNYNLLTQDYTSRDSILSNEFNNKYITNKLGLAYRFNNQKINWMIALNGQSALLKSEQYTPQNSNINKHFLSLLPMSFLNIRFSKTQNLNIGFRTSTSAPSITNLQNVIDNSNPLILTTGNPDLKQSFTSSLNIRYSRTKPENASSIFLFANTSNSMNRVANSTTIFTNDTIIDGIQFTPGMQFIKPINLSGYWNARALINYGFPFKAIKSNVNINGGFVFQRTPSLINTEKNYSNTYNFNAGISLSSNISTKIDFNLSYFASYNLIRNSLQQRNNNNYFNHTASARLNYQFWKGFVFSSQVSNTLNAGGSDAYNTNYWLWNASLAYKLLKNQSLEIKLSVNDILNQNRSITRNVTDAYTEDVHTTALQRYFLGTITYTLKKVGIGNDDNKLKDFMLPPSGAMPPHGAMPPPNH